jgi:hypothetical protein
MKSRLRFFLIPVFVLSYLGSVDFLNAGPKTEVLRGWLSDEQCANGRAESGTYTATNPRCAKECVAKGKKIVFVDPQGKRVLLLTNQEVAKKNVGDYVEITGAVDNQSKTLRVDSLKFLEKGSAMCAAPKSKKSTSE